MKKNNVKHPGKLGKVGRKKKSESDKKKQICTYFIKKDIDLLGGEIIVKQLFNEHFENKLKNI